MCPALRMDLRDVEPHHLTGWACNDKDLNSGDRRCPFADQDGCHMIIGRLGANSAVDQESTTRLCNLNSRPSAAAESGVN